MAQKRVKQPEEKVFKPREERIWRCYSCRWEFVSLPVLEGSPACPECGGRSRDITDAKEE